MSDPALTPLAERMRPRALDDVVGQEHLTAKGALLRRAAEAGRLPSFILWGPPGTGKTTLARLFAKEGNALFVPLSAVLAGVKDIREAVAEAERARTLQRQKTVLFIDEIHRWSKSQQDALLPSVEKGVVTLVGATTENPSFEVNAALLSRCRVFVLKALEQTAIASLLRKACATEAIGAGDDFVEAIALRADGDARRALNALEVSWSAATAEGRNHLGAADAEAALQHRSLLYDKAGDQHYDVVSAFIKSMRGSDPDAALHYMLRMIDAGEDPRFVLRRMVIFAAEDVGNADPRALGVAIDALQAFELVGLPEGAIPMAMAVTYLATAPKSNASYAALNAARADVAEHGALPIPEKLRNAPTRLMKQLGYGAGYQYPHDVEGHFSPERYLPDKLQARVYYLPSDQGYERELGERLKRLRALVAERDRK